MERGLEEDLTGCGSGGGGDVEHGYRFEEGEDFVDWGELGAAMETPRQRGKDAEERERDAPRKNKSHCEQSRAEKDGGEGESIEDFLDGLRLARPRRLPYRADRRERGGKALVVPRSSGEHAGGEYCEEKDEAGDRNAARERVALVQRRPRSTKEEGDAPPVVCIDRDRATFTVSNSAVTRSMRTLEVLRVVKEEDMLDRLFADVNGGEEEVDGLGEVREGDEAEGAARGENRQWEGEKRGRQCETHPNG